MADIIKFVHIGLGPMGARICKLACEKQGLELVGAIEKVKLGQDAGDVIDLGKKLNVPLTDDLEAALALKPDIAVHSTLSSLEKVKDQLVGIIRAGGVCAYDCCGPGMEG